MKKTEKLSEGVQFGENRIIWSEEMHIYAKDFRQKTTQK